MSGLLPQPQQPDLNFPVLQGDNFAETHGSVVIDKGALAQPGIRDIDGR